MVITTPSNETSTNPNSPTALITTIVVKGLPLNIMQVQVTTAIHRLLGPKNVIAVSFDRAQEDALGRHNGTAIIRCLNAAVYTHWCKRKAVPLLGRQVDFTPHSKSISGSAPHTVSKAQDSKPTREVIAEALTAFHNESSPARIFSREGRIENRILISHCRTPDHGTAGRNGKLRQRTHIGHIRCNHRTIANQQFLHNPPHSSPHRSLTTVQQPCL